MKLFCKKKKPNLNPGCVKHYTKELKGESFL